MGLNVNVLFSDVIASTEVVALSILDLAERKYAARLTKHFSQVDYLYEDDPDLDVFNLAVDLNGREDLTNRLVQHEGGQFSCKVNLGLASTDMDIAVFRAPQFGGAGTTVILSFEKQLTDYLCGYETPRIPFLLILAEFAKALGSEYFVVGLDVEPWGPISRDEFSDGRMRGKLALGWLEGGFDEKALAWSFGKDANDIKRSLLQYNFLLDFPKATR